MRSLATLFGRGEAVFSEASSRDAGNIAALHALSFRRGWSEQEVEVLLTDRLVFAHRAIYGAKLAGFIMSRLVEDEAEILSVAVTPANQGKGLARGLLDLHLRYAAGLGVRTMFLEVDEHNAPAIRLYSRAGFLEVGRRPNYYPNVAGPTATALVLRRDLA
jgi:ribosomal-protein-alanine N-acetyltransferase